MKRIIISLAFTFLFHLVTIAQTEDATIKERNIVKDSLIKMSENNTPTILKQDSAYTAPTDGQAGSTYNLAGDPPKVAGPGDDPNLTAAGKKTNPANPTDVKKNTNAKPMETSFSPGNDRIVFEKDIVVIIKDLNKLGITGWDGKEIDSPVNTPIGILHYIVNPKWLGILVISEPKLDGSNSGAGRIINSNDGSIILPEKKVTNGTVFAIPTTKGVIIDNVVSGMGGYIPFIPEDDFGVKQLGVISVEIRFDKGLNQYVVEAGVSNSSKKIIIGTESGEVQPMASK